MYIANDNRNSPLTNNELTLSGDVAAIYEILYEVINHSYMRSGNCLSVRINDRNFTLQDLWWGCREKLEQVQKGKDKTEFLLVSILEDTFRKTLPLLLVPVKDIADGDYSQPEKVNKLREIFKDNEFTRLWVKKAAEYKKVIESLGFSLEHTDYEDLTAIMEPLLNALTFYEGGEYYMSKPDIKQVRKGEKSSKSPKTMTTVCKFSSAKEYVDALMMCDEEAVISFGAVEQTEGQRIDDFYYYLTDKKWHDERTRNGMRNDNLTLEEYKNRIDKHSRVVYLGIKNGGNIWLVTMPYRQENYSCYDDSSARYYYGKRAGYAPYEVFFKDIKAAADGTTFLATRHKGYRLNEIMDDTQKIWLPVFLEETRNIFFKAESVNAAEVYLPEEVIARIPGTAYEIIPTFGLPGTQTTYCYDIPSPEEVFKDEPLILELIQFFRISAEDIKDAPLIRNTIDTYGEIEEYLSKNTRSAYIKVLAKKIGTILDEKWLLRDEILDYAFLHLGLILKQAKAGDFNNFMKITIDKEVKRDKDGNVIMEKKWHYYGSEEVPAVNTTSSADGREYDLTTLRETFYNLTIWASEETASLKPPVLITIKPKTAADFGKLFPESICSNPLVQYAEHLQYFEERYQNSLPGPTIIDRYPRRYNSIEGNIHYPDFFILHICMKKAEYKKWNIQQKNQ